ncbi:MAG: hypothetical protein JRN16_08700 [Nitrososphaerota archaeon]|nr:hypothetical protein [Nitrososphaerota archaeon]
MGSPAVADEPSEIRLWAGRRRAAGIMGVIGLAFLGVVTSETDQMIFITDDVVAAVLGGITLLLYLAWRHKTSLADLKKHTNVFTGLLVAAFALTAVWILVERGDPGAFGDDIPAVFFLIAVLANRFL